MYFLSLSANNKKNVQVAKVGLCDENKCLLASKYSKEGNIRYLVVIQFGM